jgi:GAF domain-containing protein
MNTNLAPRPANEDQRVKAVIRTGLIDAPKPEIFQVYCDLAKEISGFNSATFSLYDGEMQCELSNTGKESFEGGLRYERDKYNICSYVLLDVEPLIMNDIWDDPSWQNHPKVIDGTGARGYAGFPVINKDNFALGTLCMTDPEPRVLSNEKINLIRKVTDNIAHILDIQAEQKEVTSQKFLEALGVFQKENHQLNLDDLKVFLILSADLKAEKNTATNLIKAGLCKETENQVIAMTAKGRILQDKMKLEIKPMKKIKLSGNAAENLINQMFESLN